MARKQIGNRVIETLPAGGVDVRSNPVVMPDNRAIYQNNWVPLQNGGMRLRHGYTDLNVTDPLLNPLPNAAIHSIYPFTMPDGTNRVLFWQTGHEAVGPWVLDPATRIATNSSSFTGPKLHGKPILTNGQPFSYYLSNGKLHMVNGVDAKLFDGFALRDIGLPAADFWAPDFMVALGVGELTPTQNTAVTLTLAAGGTFLADTIGRFAYVALYDTASQELGPATINAGTTVAIKFAANQKLTFGALPVPVVATQVKLLALTQDGQAKAYFAASSQGVITKIVIADVFSLIFPFGFQYTTATCTQAGHGYSVGDVVEVDSSVLGVTGIRNVLSVPDANTFTVILTPHTAAVALGTGTSYKLIVVPNATTTGVVTAPNFGLILVNEDKGIPATTVAGAMPGYQFYVSIYNPLTGHVGNRVAIGPRQANTTRTNFKISFSHNLGTEAPYPLGTDFTEWQFLIGRTGDGATIPYVCQDSGGNFSAMPVAAVPPELYSGVSGAITLTANVLGDEMPYLNTPPPAGAILAWRVGDRIHLTTPNSPTIYLSGSEQDDRNGAYVGRPEQSFPVVRIETFPTAHNVTLGAEFNLDSWVWSSREGAILQEFNSLGWQGPYNMGGAGYRSFTKGWKSQPYWLTKEKELATMEADGPFSISDEYEAALLSRIGDQYIAQAEVIYVRNAVLRINVLRVKARDVNGNPFTVIHDFAIRDERSPYGQGYAESFAGVLAADFTTAVVRDQNDIEKVYAGGSNGRLYQLYTATNDAGTEFVADMIRIANLGPNFICLRKVEWYGDTNLQVFISTRLDTPFDINQFTDPNDGNPVNSLVPKTEGNANFYVEFQTQEMNRAYLWMRLTSHSADGTIALNSQPRIPVETYGHVYLVSPGIDPASGRE